MNGGWFGSQLNYLFGRIDKTLSLEINRVICENLEFSEDSFGHEWLKLLG